MATHNNQHTDLNSENTGSLALDLRENFRAAIDPSRPPPIELATLSQEHLLLKQTLASYADIALGAGGKEQNDRNVQVAHAGMANISHNIFERNMRAINAQIDSNLAQSCQLYRLKAQRMARDEDTESFQPFSASYDAPQSPEELEIKEKISSLDARASSLQNRIDTIMEHLESHKGSVSRGMADSYKTRKEYMSALDENRTLEDGVLEELGLTREDIKYFSYRDPNKDEYLLESTSHNPRMRGFDNGMGDFNSGKPWYEISLTDKDGNAIPLTDEQKDILRSARQDVDNARQMNDFVRQSALSNKFNFSATQQELDSLLTEQQAIDEARSNLKQEISQNEFLSSQFVYYVRDNGTPMSKDEIKFENVREQLALTKLVEAYNEDRSNNPPPYADENNQWTSEPRGGRIQPLFDRNPEAAAGFMLLVRDNNPEFAARLAAKHPELMVKIDRTIALAKGDIDETEVKIFIEENNTPSDASIAHESVQSVNPAHTALESNAPIRTESGIVASAKPSMDFNAAAHQAPPETEMPAPEPSLPDTMPEIQRQPVQPAQAFM